jgi:WD40 repeat protein
VWDAATGKPLADPLRSDWPVLGARFDPEGGRILTWSDDGTARLWDAATGKPLALRGHNAFPIDPLRSDGAVYGARFDAEAWRYWAPILFLYNTYFQCFERYA